MVGAIGGEEAMKRSSKLKSARLACKWRGYEVAEKLGMYVIRYMAIEANCWEEPTEEEVLKICAFFGMSPLALGFGSKFWSLSGVVQRDRTPLEKGTVMQLKLW
jgi:transcriptional regulator with XRE-family HTH domain